MKTRRVTDRFKIVNGISLKLALLLLLNIFVAQNRSYCQDKPPAKADPVMTDELMGRLITRTLASKKDAEIDMKISGIFGINDGKAHVPVKKIGETAPEGKHVFIIPVKEGSKDIVVLFNRGEVIEAYLTDRSGVLRAAAIFDATGI